MVSRVVSFFFTINRSTISNPPNSLSAFHTGDPDDPPPESVVVSMSMDGRVPGVSEMTRTSDTTPSMAEKT